MPVFKEEITAGFEDAIKNIYSSLRERYEIDISESRKKVIDKINKKIEELDKKIKETKNVITLSKLLSMKRELKAARTIIKRHKRKIHLFIPVSIVQRSKSGKRYIRSYKVWTKKEINLLKSMLKQKRTLKDISKALGRSLSSVKTKIYRLGKK